MEDKIPQMPSEELQELLQRLPLLHRADRLQIRAAINSIDTRMDVFGCLSVELQIMVASCMHPADIYACLNVSKTWRAVLLQTQVRNILIRQRLPRLAEYIRSTIDAETENDRVTALFWKETRSQAKRKRGKFHTMLVADDKYGVSVVGPRPPSRETAKYANVDYDAGSDDTETTEDGLSPKSYNNGRVDWYPIYDSGKTSFVVDDLRTTTRLQLNMPYDVVCGKPFKITVLGDTFYVAVSVNCVVAWDLRTGETFKKVLRFFTPEKAATSGKRVYLFGDRQLYYWKVGRPMRQVDTSAVLSRDDSETMKPFLLIGPEQDEVLFIWSYKLLAVQHQPLQMLVNVHEFHGTRFVRTHTHITLFLSASSSSHYRLTCVESALASDVYGTFRLISWPLEGRYKQLSVRTLCFNGYSKSFRVMSHHLPTEFSSGELLELPPFVALGQNCWNGQLSLVCSSMPNTLTVLCAFDEQDAIQSEPADESWPDCLANIRDDPMHTNQSAAREVRQMLLRKIAVPEYGMRYALDPPSWARGSLMHRVMSDEDFEVAFYGTRAVIWSFEPTLPFLQSQTQSSQNQNQLIQ